MAQGRRTETENVITELHGYTVTLTWAHYALGLSANAIREWKVKPVRTDCNPHLYDIIELIKYKVNQVETKLASKDKKLKLLEGEHKEPQDLLKIAQAEGQNIKNMRMKSELLDKRIVEEVILQIISRFRQGVLAVPSRVSSQCAAAETRQEAYTILVAEMHSLLETLADFDISKCHEDIEYLNPITDDDEAFLIEDSSQGKKPEPPKKRGRGRPRKVDKE